MTQYADVLAAIAELRRGANRPVVVGISGHGGAGKSTLADRLAHDLGQSPDQVIGMDELFAKDSGPDVGMWELHDWATLTNLLRGIHAGGAQRLTFAYRWYDGTAGVRDEPMPAVLIVEGIRLFRPQTLALFDVTVWIAMTPETAGARAIARNVGQGDSQSELDLWHTKWIPEGVDYEREVDPAAAADFVVAAEGTAPPE